jgi:8-oxo-dGTP pyrophosphatase MutT (NUDIX family)
VTAPRSWDIDAGGPVDPTVEPQAVDEVDRPAAFTLMAPGWHPPRDSISQSYGFCFTASRDVVLVRLEPDFWNLPGGQVEPGEDPADTLVREVAEEACARVLRAHYLACQHVWDPEAPDGRTSHYQARWWARVELDPWTPCHETVARRLVPPKLVVPNLSWSGKAIAARLLATAVAFDAKLGACGGGEGPVRCG